MTYVDTSALGAVFFREEGARSVLRVLRARSATGLVISTWTLTEMASVGSIKERTGAAGRSVRAAALAAFQRFASAKLKTIEVEPADFRTAAVLIDQLGGLRAGDALHLAIVQRLSADLATLDRRLAGAAAACGIATVSLVDS